MTDAGSFHVEVIAVERVGADWLECRYCGCKHPPESDCPYQRFHEDPDALDAEAMQAIGRAEPS